MDNLKNNLRLCETTRQKTRRFWDKTRNEKL